MLPDLRMVNNEDADDIVDKHYYDDDENNNDDDNNCNNADSGISTMEKIIQRAANFASTASCTCGTNTFTCNQVFLTLSHATRFFYHRELS